MVLSGCKLDLVTCSLVIIIIPLAIMDLSRISAQGRIVGSRNSKVEDDGTETLTEFIKQVDTTGVIRKFIRRKMHIPKDSSLSWTSQVSRPNIFPDIFNQGEGFIVDAVIEWPITLELHELAEALYATEKDKDKDTTSDSDGRTDLDEYEDEGEQIIGDDYSDSEEESGSFRGNAMSAIVGVERCLIYEKVEMGMSLYLDISRNTSHDCVLRAICEAQMISEHYPDAPSSIFFEVIHLILTPSLGANNACHLDYLKAETAASVVPDHCSHYVSKCPLNIAALFVRNFFPDILSSTSTGNFYKH